MTERVVVFGTASPLVGIVHEPPPARLAEAPAVVLLSAGMVHRIGPNRLYVKLARAMAEMGHVVLRFDFSGFGDSPARPDHLPFVKSAPDEAREAMNFLSARHGCERFVLMGLCSGATTSLKAAASDPRVAGAVLINARAGGEELQSYIKGQSALRKYGQYLAQNRGRWLAAIRERMHLRGMLNVVRALGRDVAGALRPARKSFPESRESADAIRIVTERGARLLAVCSEWDPGLDFMNVVLKDRALRNGSDTQPRLVVVPEADHTFTQTEKQRALIDAIRDWLPEVGPASQARHPEFATAE